MSALVFLALRSARNSLRDLFRKPGKLALYAFVLIMLAFNAVSASGRSGSGDPWPISVLIACVFALMALMVFSTVTKGLSGSGELFGMSDACLLFVSPVNARLTLVYGILRAAKASVLGFFFLLFYAGIFSNFGVSYGGVLLAALGVMLGSTALMVASSAIFSAVNGRPRRKNAARLVALAAFVPYLAPLALGFFKSGDALAALEAAAPFLAFVPLAGWTAAALGAFFAGNAAV
ncbi:MAG: putative ABC exporter domain-containing protein, partial [Treponema sp.]|nr:putative ABC exporter domain-containing protein [Treponema sp.]